MRVQVKVCQDPRCWYCPRIVPHLPPNLGFFPFYTVADGESGWVPVHERHAEMQHEDEAVRAIAHDLYVTDKWLPDNCVKRAWRSSPYCSPRRARLIASATNLSERTVVAMFLKLNEEEARRTDIARACEACHSEAINDPQLGAMLFCDHMEHTRVCNAARHLTCCPQPLQSVPKGKWFCPTHAGTHASFPAFAVVTARTTHEEPISTRTETVGAHGDAHGAATTAQAALDSATQNGTDLRDSGEASGPSDSDEDSESDSDVDEVRGCQCGSGWTTRQWARARSARRGGACNGLRHTAPRTRAMQCAADATRTTNTTTASCFSFCFFLESTFLW